MLERPSAWLPSRSMPKTLWCKYYVLYLYNSLARCKPCPTVQFPLSDTFSETYYWSPIVSHRISMNSGVEMHAVYGIALNRSSYSQSEACPALVNNTPNHMISMRHFPSSEADIFENAFLQQRTKELIMVFRGKPSRSCGRCRDRRLRVSPKSGNHIHLPNWVLTADVVWF